MYEFSEFKIFHHLDRIRAICRGELPPPVTFEVDLTNACNHRCIWCPDHAHNPRIDATLKEGPFLNFAEQIAEQGVRSVVFNGGGEPLLYYSFSKIVHYLRSKGLEMGLISNGETINRHLEAIPYLSWVSVSLDAATTETHQKLHKPFKTNAFNGIVDNLYQISSSTFTGVIYVVHPANIHEMEAAAHLARDLGCRYITFRCVVGEESHKFTPEMKREVDELMIKIKQEQEDINFQVFGSRLYHFYQGSKNLPYNVCLAHHLVGILGADGYLYPCFALQGEVNYSYGSIYRESFQDIWCGETRKAVLQKITQKECADRCLGRTSYLRYDHYNKLFEYLTSDKEKVGNIDFL